MITSIFYLCASFAAGWALRPASGQTNFATTIPTTTPITTPTICVRTSRARRNVRQAKQMRLAYIPGPGGTVLKSYVPSAEKSGFGCPKVWFWVLESLVPGLSRRLDLPFAGEADKRAEAEKVVRLGSEPGHAGRKRRAAPPPPQPHEKSLNSSLSAAKLSLILAASNFGASECSP